MCCLPVDQNLQAPRDSLCARCSPQSLALRLRWVGDQLEKSRATNNVCVGNAAKSSNTSVKGIHMVCTAIQVTVLILFVGKRHL